MNQEILLLYDPTVPVPLRVNGIEKAANNV